MSKCYDNPDYDDLGNGPQNTWEHQYTYEQKHEAKVMKNIHVLPTDKPSRLWMTKLGNLTRCHAIKPIKEALGNNVNIYITSDEEIKEGDWFYNTISLKPEPFKACENGDGYVNCSKYSHYRIYCKKIILTTDQDLIKDGIQAIDDEFLEYFVSVPLGEIKEVKVIKHLVWEEYKIIIPKEDLSYTTKSGIKVSDEMVRATMIPKEYFGKEDSKQETLEEAAERLTYHDTLDWENTLAMESFKLGAKWMQEKMYSEEDFKLFTRQFYREIKLDNSNLLWEELADKCLEQFKKK